MSAGRLLPADVCEAMIAHALEVHPQEACGLLAAGSDGIVRRVYCLDNVERSEVAFTVDPDGHFAALTDAESRGWAIGGVFHSHPRGPAAPSPTDLRAGIDPGWIHVIIGLSDPATPEVRVWSIRGGAAVELGMPGSSCDEPSGMGPRLGTLGADEGGRS